MITMDTSFRNAQPNKCRIHFVNPCPAELFQLDFSSFEAGIQMKKNIYIF